MIGIGAGARAELNLRLLMAKRGTVHSSTLRARPLEEKALTARALERSVLPLLASGAVTVPIAETFALSDAEAAYDRFAAGSKLGKIVLEIGLTPVRAIPPARGVSLPRAGRAGGAYSSPKASSSSPSATSSSA